DIVKFIESLAPPALQESFDNAGLQTGSLAAKVSAAVITLDVTEEVVDEAIQKQAGLIITHHPVIFGGLKKLTESNSVERIVAKAIRNNIAIYAAHTNIDNIQGGVNTKIADLTGLEQQRILQPAKSQLCKLATFVPHAQLDIVRNALFEAGAGHIGNYNQCSFNAKGEGTFRGGENTNPFAGEKETFHVEPETRLETIFPRWKEKNVIDALLKAHPYEEVAYDIYPLENRYEKAGSGIVGKLPHPVDEEFFLEKIKATFGTPVLRHSPLLRKPVHSVAICGGAGSFLLRDAIAAKADIFVTADIKYHQFFEPEGRILFVDIGHYESEQFTKELFYELLTKKFPTFAIHLSEVKTNPVNYY
ncbi:MAG: Nif3-like dinuclear metal center hexameric protein, partial [Prolixibacteraceae bacterium]|nr:Nif3-like dinuclear metal center hexameric protein [Prolixibacteraceae bacterium]